MGALWRVFTGHEPPWYKFIEKHLEPYDMVVRLMLVLIIAISVVLLIAPSRSARLLWFIYLASP